MSWAASIAALLPEGWSLLAEPMAGTVLQVAGPDDGGYRANVSIFAVDPAAAGEAVEAAVRELGEADRPTPVAVVHDAQIDDAFRLMTDAVLIDHRPLQVDGADAFTSTIAFRQGPWTLTSMLWTLPGADGPVVIAACSDAAEFSVRVALFEAIVDALGLGVAAGA